MRIYMRVAKTNRGYRYATTSKPSNVPLTTTQGTFLPTVFFAFDLKLPSNAFTTPNVGELVVPPQAIRPLVELDVAP